MTKYTLHNKLQLWATEEEYVIEPTGTDDLPMVINRGTGEISMTPLDPTVSRLQRSPMQIHGVMGILKLSTSKQKQSLPLTPGLTASGAERKC